METEIAQIAQLAHQGYKPASELQVIFVDDDADDREIITEAMGKAVPDVQFVALVSCTELLSKLNRLSPLPRLVVLDLNLPQLNGLDCLKQIRANSNYNGLQVIIYSTSANPTDIASAKAAGALLYIRKPWQYNEIVDIFKMVIDRLIANPATPGFEKFYLNPEIKKF